MWWGQLNETGGLGAALRSQVGPRRNIDGGGPGGKAQEAPGFYRFHRA